MFKIRKAKVLGTEHVFFDEAQKGSLWPLWPRKAENEARFLLDIVEKSLCFVGWEEYEWLPLGVQESIDIVAAREDQSMGVEDWDRDKRKLQRKAFGKYRGAKLDGETRPHSLENKGVRIGGRDGC